MTVKNMEHIIVADFNRELIAGCSGKAFVIKTENPADLPEIHKAVEAGNKLHCVYLRPGKPLPEVEYKAEYGDIPVALEVPRVGPFRGMAGKAALLRSANLRVLLDSSPEGLVAARILSSLGINCALGINGATVKWDALSDLLTYTVYAKAEHAGIEPLVSQAKAYNPEKLRVFPAGHFTEPSRYLHCDAQGRLAISGAGLAAGEFVGDLKALGAVKSAPPYIEKSEAWREHFTAVDACSKCPGWRLCGGTFAPSVPANPGCRGFFTELVDAAEYAGKKKDKRPGVWQI